MSAVRPKRDAKADITPTFLLDGAKLEPGENPREAYARMLTTHPQFARAAVNLIWAELMGTGIVDGPFDFDLARQDPKNPPPAPWTVQPSHPELLEALAEDFRSHSHDLRRLIRMIVSSRAYQLSTATPAGWKEGHDTYFARHKVRRLSAEQIWDAISQVSGVFPTFQVTFSPKKVNYLMQTRSPQDLDKTDRKFYKVVQQFGQCDRYTAEADRRAGMVQAAMLLNHGLLRERVKVQKGSRIEQLLKGPDKQLVEDLFLAGLSRLPSPDEEKVALEALAGGRDAGAEDLLWAMINRLDFLFY
jgi:hypothetical protein